jgi:two-component system cell cycle response regulator DivK
VANELILVVEDNDKNRKLVRDVLTFKGYEIIEAETGEEGVRLAQERHPSLVLMDIRRPGIDGIEALRRLRAEPAVASSAGIRSTALGTINAPGDRRLKANGTPRRSRSLTDSALTQQPVPF